MRQPMLCTGKEPADVVVRYVHDDAFVLQPKLDGDRLLIEVAAGIPTASGRDGQLSKHNETLRSPAWLAEFAAFPNQHFVILDCELVDGRLHVFDLVAEDAGSVVTPVTVVEPSTPLQERIGRLGELMEKWSSPMATLVPTAFTLAGKAEMAMDVLRARGEGVVAKRIASPYRWGRSPDWVKVKFIHDADLVVKETGVEGKESCVLIAYDETGEEVAVGRASTYGKRWVEPGAVVIVHYGRFSDDGRLVQPRLMRRRTDKAPRECTLDQLTGTG